MMTRLSNPTRQSPRAAAVAPAWRAFAGLILGALLLLVATPGQATEEAARKAEGHVAAFVDDGLDLLREDGLTPDQQVDRFRTLFRDYFAVDAIARWVLGRHARQASEAEWREYRSLFEDLVVYGYVKRFREYSGQVVTIERSVAETASMSTVFSKVTRAGDKQIYDVAWRVGVRGDEARITDVVIENASLATTWRSDFASTIRAEGGTVAGLLTVLRQRVADLKAEFAKES